MLAWLAPYSNALVLLGPWLLPCLPALVAGLTRPFKPKPPPPAWSTVALCLIACHSAYHLFHLWFRPDNVWLQTGLPLFSTPISRLHAALVALAQSSSTASSSVASGLASPPQLADSTLLLLQRLQSFDARDLYGRFGESTLVSCTWCAIDSTKDWFAFWSVDRALEYIGETFVWAFLTEGTPRRRWRALGCLVVGGASLAEVIWTGFVARIAIERGDGFQLFTRMHLVRHAGFLLLPLVLHYLPPSPDRPPPSLVSLPPIVQSAENLLSHLKLLETSRVAVSRQPLLRARLVDVGRQMNEDAQLGRTDAGVRAAGESVGLTGEEGVHGGLRDGATKFLEVARRKVHASLGSPPMR